MPDGARWAMPCSIWMLYDESVYEVYVHENRNIVIDVSLMKLAITLSSLFPSLIIKFAVCKFSSTANVSEIYFVLRIIFYSSIEWKTALLQWIRLLFFISYGCNELKSCDQQRDDHNRVAQRTPYKMRTRLNVPRAWGTLSRFPIFFETAIFPYLAAVGFWPHSCWWKTWRPTSVPIFVNLAQFNCMLQSNM